jgi:hypothetical protein
MVDYPSEEHDAIYVVYDNNEMESKLYPFLSSYFCSKAEKK